MSQTDHAIHVKTVFCDLDGCIFRHHGDISAIISKPCELLPGVLESFADWVKKGYTIVLTTGRPKSLRDLTNQQIRDVGLYYHHLIMDLPRGQRVLINDIKPEQGTNTAVCVNIERNKGMQNVNI